MADFTPIVEEPRPRRQKRVGATTDSIALIANNGGTGIILAQEGGDIEIDSDAVGSLRLDDRGLDNAPDGLSIWEGRIHVSAGSYEHPEEVDTELVGKFRDLTPDEWAELSVSGIPWRFEDPAQAYQVEDTVKDLGGHEYILVERAPESVHSGYTNADEWIVDRMKDGKRIRRRTPLPEYHMTLIEREGVKIVPPVCICGDIDYSDPREAGLSCPAHP